MVDIIYVYASSCHYNSIEYNMKWMIQAIILAAGWIIVLHDIGVV